MRLKVVHTNGRLPMSSLVFEISIGGGDFRFGRLIEEKLAALNLGFPGVTHSNRYTIIHYARYPGLPV